MGKLTDGDGLVDGKDTNARFENINNESTLLYSFLINNTEIGKSYFLPFSKQNSGTIQLYDIKKKVVEPQTIIIFTDDSQIQHITNTNAKCIILPESESDNYLIENHDTPTMMYISPLKKTSLFSKQYDLSISGGFWSNAYQVTLTDTGWIIKNTYSAIE